jgi:ribosomal protein S18 acetylase RimI-like enzyme
MLDSIAYRPETEADAPFVYSLYASTREEEMKVVPWTDEEKEAFVRMQYRAQTTSYRANYPDAHFMIIQRDGADIGRLYISRIPGEVRIMEITLIPEQRGNGLGGAILRGILGEAEGRGEAVSIHVENFNPALRLYQRLGFRKIDEHGVYYLMEWTPGSTPA